MKNTWYIPIITMVVMSFSLLGTTTAIEFLDPARRVMKIDIDKYDIVVWTAPVGSTVSVMDEVKKRGGEAGINGTFFCPAEKSYSRCGADNSTSSERIVGGQDTSRYIMDTGERGIIGIDGSGLALFVQNNLGYVGGYMGNTNSELRHTFVNALGNFPILVDNGLPLNSSIQHLVTDKRFLSAARRAFVCIPDDRKSLIWGYTTPMSLLDVGEFITREYGCMWALSLDAGASSALVYRGDHLIGPGRKVVDGYIAIPKQEWLDQMMREYVLTTQEKQLLVDIITYFWRMRKTNDLSLEELIQKIDTAESSIGNRSDVPKRVILQRLSRLLSEQKNNTEGTMFRPLGQ